MENANDSLEEIDILIQDIKKCIQSKNVVELDVLKRKAIVISEEALGDKNSYIDDLSELDFLDTKFGPRTLNIYTNDFVMESGRFKNILEEIKFKIQRIKNSSSSKLVDSRPKEPVTIREKEIKYTEARSDEAKIQSNKIFIVHGHDEAMKQTIARFIENLELKPIILQEQPGGSSTIIERFEANSDVSFAIILFSPDDLAYLDNNLGCVKYRARQNVIFEMGYFIGRLNRNRVISLCRDPAKLDLPSDYHGIIYIEYDYMGGWKSKLFKELKACYPYIDANKMV